MRNEGIGADGVPRFSDVGMAVGADDVKDGRGLAVADNEPGVRGCAVARVLIIEARERLGRALAERLRGSPAVKACRHAMRSEDAGSGIDTLVYSPPPARRDRAAPDLADAERVFREFARPEVTCVVVVSSATVYGPNCHNPGLMAEAKPACRHRKNRVAVAWLELERLAAELLGDGEGWQLTILRAAPVPLRDGVGPLGGLFRRRVAVVPPGHDPSIQLLSKVALVAVARKLLVIVNAVVRGGRPWDPALAATPHG